MEEYIKKFGGVHVIDEVETLLSDEKSAVAVLIEQLAREATRVAEIEAHWVADAYEAMSYGKRNRIKRGLVPKAKYMYRLWKVIRGWNDGEIGEI